MKTRRGTFFKLPIISEKFSGYFCSIKFLVIVNIVPVDIVNIPWFTTGFIHETGGCLGFLNHQQYEGIFSFCCSHQLPQLRLTQPMDPEKNSFPKYPDPSKVPILRTRTPAIQVPTPPLEGPRILRVERLIFPTKYVIPKSLSRLAIG